MRRVDCGLRGGKLVNLLSPKEAAAILAVSESSLRRLKLPRVKLGKQYRYRSADVDFINVHVEYPRSEGAMSVEYRADRKKWGYRFYLAGICYKKYAWDSKTEAKQAEQEAQVEARKNPALQPTALVTAASASEKTNPIGCSGRTLTGCRAK